MLRQRKSKEVAIRLDTLTSIILAGESLLNHLGWRAEDIAQMFKHFITPFAQYLQ